MSQRTMTIAEVIDYIANADTCDDFAFRGDDYIPSDTFNNSRYHGDDMDEYELPGVSAIWLPAREAEYIEWSIAKAGQYGEHVFLLQGVQQNADEITGDANECLMVSHKIVGIVA